MNEIERIELDERRKIHLVFLHPHFTLPGGAGNVVLAVASRLDQRKYNVSVICIRVNAAFKEQYPQISFIEIGGPLPSETLFWISYAGTQWKIHKVLDRINPDILLPTVLPANWWAFTYRIINKRCRCFWYCHEPSAFIHFPKWINSIQNPLLRAGAKILNPVLKRIDYYLVKHGKDACACNSQFTKGLYKKIYGETIEDFIYPGADLTFFVPMPSKKKYFFVMSRLSRFKNIDRVIRAMAAMRHTDFALLIGGEGEEKENLVKFVRSLNLSERIQFIGEVPFRELPAFYGEAKLVLFPSENEPFGMVPVEALACGTPVIASNSGGPIETVGNDFNGILLDSMTPRTIQEAIDSLLDDPDRYNRLQDNTRSSAERFNWPQHIDHLEKLIEKLRSSGWN